MSLKLWYMQRALVDSGAYDDLPEPPEDHEPYDAGDEEEPWEGPEYQEPWEDSDLPDSE